MNLTGETDDSYWPVDTDQYIYQSANSIRNRLLGE